MSQFEKAQAKMIYRGKFAQNLITESRPDLLPLFFTYQNEASEARKFLNKRLTELENGARILEIGGGILAL